MTLFLILLAIVLMGTGIAGGNIALQSKRSHNTYGLSVREADQLSWPARQIVAKFLSLPEANRPHANIQAVVKALDIKHNVKTVNEHFTTKGNGFDSMGYRTTIYQPSWDCSGEHRFGSREKCQFREYIDLHTIMTDIEQALAEQEHALALAGVQTGLDAVKELTKALYEEKKIIREVTVETRKQIEA